MLFVGSGGIRTNVVNWWLKLLPKSDQPLTMALFADACISVNVTSCGDTADKFAEHIASTYGSQIKIHIVRGQPVADQGYQRLACKLLTCAVQAYAHFPDFQYYMKIDDDTVVFPRRLMRLVNTLHSVVANDSVPLYFGTISHLQKNTPLCGELGWVANSGDHQGGRLTYQRKDGTTEGQAICYAQGGAGYVLNNAAMRGFVSQPKLCVPEMDLEAASEDTYVGYKLLRDLGALVIHCGGFRPNGVAADSHMDTAVTFHRVSDHWLASRNISDLRARFADLF